MAKPSIIAPLAKAISEAQSEADMPAALPAMKWANTYLSAVAAIMREKVVEANKQRLLMNMMSQKPKIYARCGCSQP